MYFTGNYRRQVALFRTTAFDLPLFLSFQKMEMITSNAISKLVQVAGVDSSFSPVVQVVSLKQVGNSNDRYRVSHHETLFYKRKSSL